MSSTNSYLRNTKTTLLSSSFKENNLPQKTVKNFANEKAMKINDEVERPALKMLNDLNSKV